MGFGGQDAGQQGWLEAGVYYNVYVSVCVRASVCMCVARCEALICSFAECKCFRGNL